MYEVSESDVCQCLNEIDVSCLPIQLCFLISLIGVDDAFLFVQIYGGRKIYVPKNPSRSKMKEKIKIESLKKLSDCFCGEMIEVPKVDHFYRYVRNVKIIEQIKQGLPKALIAKKYNISYRQVGNIKKEMMFLFSS